MRLLMERILFSTVISYVLLFPSMGSGLLNKHKSTIPTITMNTTMIIRKKNLRLCNLRTCGPLKIHTDKHHLAYADGEPFYYMADTPWHLLAELSSEDAYRFIDARLAQGFTVLQLSALPMNPGMKNFYDEGPGNMSPPVLNEPYWNLIDKILDYMEINGMVAYMVPIWATNWVGTMTVSDHMELGKLLGKRWKSKHNLLYVLGGDEPGKVSGDKYLALLQGLTIGNGNRTSMLVTCHVSGGFSSSTHCGNANLITQLDFDSIQDRSSTKVCPLILQDFTGSRRRPTLLAETFYENITSGGFYNLHLTRGPALREVYWEGRLCGSLGDAYGAWGLWFTMLKENRTTWCQGNDCCPSYGWVKDIQLPGAVDIARHIQDILKILQWWTLVPDRSQIESKAVSGLYVARTHHYQDIILYTKQPLDDIKINTIDVFGTPNITVGWYDPSGGNQSGRNTSFVKNTTILSTSGIIMLPPHPWKGDAVFILRPLHSQSLS